MKKIYKAGRQSLTVALLSVTAMSAQAQFRLQLLHSSDMEAGLSAIENAPNFVAIVDSLERTYPENTLKLSGGDNFIPGPFLNASTDAGLRSAIQAANAFLFNDTEGTSRLRENYGRTDISIMNIVGFHASALGNHEFDLGPNVLADAVRVEISGTEVRWSGAQFPYLSANLDFTAESSLLGLYTDQILPANAYRTLPSDALTASFTKKIAPATTVVINGEKIGIVGVTTQVLETLSSVGGVRVKGIKENDMEVLASYIQPYIDQLRDEHGCNKIILLSHLQQIRFEKELIGKLSGVDIIVAAGSNTLQADPTDILRSGDQAKETYPYLTKNKDNDDAIVVSTDGEWKYVGRLVVDFDEEGRIIPESLDQSVNGAYATDQAGVTRVWGEHEKAFGTGSKGNVVKELCNALNDIITFQDGSVYGKTIVFLEGRRTSVRSEETNFGNLSADANLWYARQIDPTVKVSIKNGGGIRSAIGYISVSGEDNVVRMLPPQANPAAGKQEGDISQLDILNALRFNNGLTLVSLTPEQLRLTMEHAVSGWSPSATPGAFPQIGGMRFRFDPSKETGKRISEIVVVDENGTIEDVLIQRGQIVGDPSRIIRVVSLNFLVDQSGAGPNGGDGYPFNVFVLENPERANKVFITKGTGEEKTGNALFAADGSEQDALAEYLYEKFRTEPYSSGETQARDDERIQNLNYQADKFPSTERKVLFIQGEVKVMNGGFGSDMCLVPGTTDQFYMLTDRGPNADSTSGVATKIFSNPEFAPQIGHFVIKGDRLELVKKIELKRNDGTKLTGLPNPQGMGSTGEVARNLDLQLLEADPEGIDSEGLVAMEDGSFWICDEYGPHLLHVDAEGKTIERINPFGTGFGGRTMPQVFAYRRANRGMEGLTITPDKKTLVGIIQSTMHNPRNSGLNAKTTRILFYDIETGASKQYVYRQEKNNNSNSGIVAVTSAKFLVLERDGDFQGGTPDAAYKRFYLIDIEDATDVSDPDNHEHGMMFGEKTLEQLTDIELQENDIVPVSKVLISDLLVDLPEYPHEKLEGMAIINDSTLVVINDDDFAVSPDLQGGYEQKVLPLNGKIDINTLYYVPLRFKLDRTDVVTSMPFVAEEPSLSSGIRVFPNPAKDVVYFSETIVKGTLYDLVGNPIAELENRDDFDVSGLSEGIYVIRTEKNQFVRILIK